MAESAGDKWISALFSASPHVTPRSVARAARCPDSASRLGCHRPHLNFFHFKTFAMGKWSVARLLRVLRCSQLYRTLNYHDDVLKEKFKSMVYVATRTELKVCMLTRTIVELVLLTGHSWRRGSPRSLMKPSLASWILVIHSRRHSLTYWSRYVLMSLRSV